MFALEVANLERRPDAPVQDRPFADEDTIMHETRRVIKKLLAIPVSRTTAGEPATMGRVLFVFTGEQNYVPVRVGEDEMRAPVYQAHRADAATAMERVLVEDYGMSETGSIVSTLPLPNGIKREKTVFGTSIPGLTFERDREFTSRLVEGQVDFRITWWASHTEPQIPAAKLQLEPSVS